MSRHLLHISCHMPLNKCGSRCHGASFRTVEKIAAQVVFPTERFVLPKVGHGSKQEQCLAWHNTAQHMYRQLQTTNSPSLTLIIRNPFHFTRITRHIVASISIHIATTLRSSTTRHSPSYVFVPGPLPDSSAHQRRTPHLRRSRCTLYDGLSQS